jgi:hypothetical protein
VDSFTGPEAEIGAGFGPQIAQDSCEPEKAARGEPIKPFKNVTLAMIVKTFEM